MGTNGGIDSRQEEKLAAEMETKMGTLMEIGLLIHMGGGMELSIGKGRTVHMRLKFGT